LQSSTYLVDLRVRHALGNVGGRLASDRADERVCSSLFDETLDDGDVPICGGAHCDMSDRDQP
jgi:hypothetical protein